VASTVLVTKEGEEYTHRMRGALQPRVEEPGAVMVGKLPDQILARGNCRRILPLFGGNGGDPDPSIQDSDG